MATDIDRESIRDAYNEVRNDSSDINWLACKFEGTGIVLDSTGVEYEEFKSKFTDDERAFGFARITTGDEMSKRAKFVLITWVGKNVGALKRAKMSTDKSILKQVIQNFATELRIEELEDMDYEIVKSEVERAGGANYGTGMRD